MRLPLLNLGIALALCSQAPLFAQETKPEQKKSSERTSGKPATDKQAAPAKPTWNPYSTLQQYKIVAAIDEDLNGMITAKEWDSSVERILKLDTNGDGKLVSEEFLKEGEIAKSVLGFGVVKGLDVDQDGSLSAEEIKDAVEVLKKLDSNKSGKLEPNEYAMKSPMSMGGGGAGRGGGAGGGRQMPSPEEFMKSNDKNSDGKVEKSELTGPAANFFDRMDENKDGAITIEEVKASRERMRQQGGGGGRGGPGSGGPSGGGPGGSGAPSAASGEGEKKEAAPKTDAPK